MEELETLLARAQDGDLEAYGEIVHRFQDMAVGYARAILGDFHLAEDVAQEAFVEAYLNLSKVYGAHAFPSWLRTIVFKFCDRQTRKKKVRLVPLETAAELRAEDMGPAALDARAHVGRSEIRGAKIIHRGAVLRGIAASVYLKADQSSDLSAPGTSRSGKV